MQVTENAVKMSTTSIATNDLRETKQTDSNPHESITVPKAINAGQQSHTMSQNASNQMNSSSIGAVAAEDETKRVNISQQSINTILIGNRVPQFVIKFSASLKFLNVFSSAIIVVALIGLLIGVICRIDCFGVKTRMCRSRRRPAPTDQVRPAEEVPLNKV